MIAGHDKQGYSSCGDFQESPVGPIDDRRMNAGPEEEIAPVHDGVGFRARNVVQNVIEVGEKVGAPTQSA